AGVRLALDRLRQTLDVFAVEQLVLERMAEIGVDQQRACAELRERDGELGSELRTALAVVGAEYRDDVGLAGRRAAQLQLRAQRADLLAVGAVGLARERQPATRLDLGAVRDH